MKKLVCVVLSLVLVLTLVVSASALTLKKGSRGSAVKELQIALNNGGYSSLKIDGVYGSGTIAAVKLYQAANGMKVDGIAGPKTLYKLLGTSNPDNNPEGSFSVMTKGSTGIAVREVQKALKNLGYPVGTVDGTYGSKTVTAVRYFQSLNDLKVDGKVGETTYNLLMSGNAVKYSKVVTYTTLRKGMSGSLVTKLQTRLADLGYYTEPVTGYYNDDTVDAVFDFQQNNNLTADGVAGPKTQALLYSGNAQ